MEMGVALKDSSNPFYKSKFADINAVIDAIVPVLNTNGVLVSQVTKVLGLEFGNPLPVLRTTLTHAESGESQESDTMIICAKPNDPQDMGSAISYARRYGLQAMVVLKAEDDDGNKGSGKTTEPTKQKESSPEVKQAPKKSGFGGKAATATANKNGLF
jgi:hypothetical protein